MGRAASGEHSFAVRFNRTCVVDDAGEEQRQSLGLVFVETASDNRFDRSRIDRPHRLAHRSSPRGEAQNVPAPVLRTRRSLDQGLTLDPIQQPREIVPAPKKGARVRAQTACKPVSPARSHSRCRTSYQASGGSPACFSAASTRANASRSAFSSRVQASTTGLDGLSVTLQSPQRRY